MPAPNSWDQTIELASARLVAPLCRPPVAFAESRLVLLLSVPPLHVTTALVAVGALLERKIKVNYKMKVVAGENIASSGEDRSKPFEFRLVGVVDV